MGNFVFLFHTPHGPEVRRFSHSKLLKAYAAQMRMTFGRVQYISEHVASCVDFFGRR